MVNDTSKKYIIAVGLDGSESSWKALEEAVQQARRKDAALHVVSIQESAEASYSASAVLESEKTSRERLEHIQIKARMLAANENVDVVSAIVAGASEAALVDYVRKNDVQLLVVGDTGHSSIWGALLGTTAEKIVRSAPCSVLIVR